MLANIAALIPLLAICAGVLHNVTFIACIQPTLFNLLTIEDHLSAGFFFVLPLLVWQFITYIQPNLEVTPNIETEKDTEKLGVNRKISNPERKASTLFIVG